ncbi:hypothetical protein EJB05_03969, partial [Eragrostis curvula]
MEGIKDLKMKTIAKRRNIHQAQVSTPLSCADEGTRNQGTVVLNPIAARRVGRPPLARKESEADGKVRKMRGKKQGASTSRALFPLKPSTLQEIGRPAPLKPKRQSSQSAQIQARHGDVTQLGVAAHAKASMATAAV